MRKIKAKKKVVASFGTVAASGGYYIAASANHIMANPGTLTGSIGVVMEFANFRELLKKLGISFELLKSGELKDTGSPVRPMSPKEREFLENLLKDIHRQFLQDVASGRNLTKEQVGSIADARILTGEQAKKLGLVDSLGNFNDAVDQAKKLAGISGEVKVIYPEKKKISLFDILWGKMEERIQESLSTWMAVPLLIAPPLSPSGN